MDTEKHENWKEANISINHMYSFIREIVGENP